MTGDLARRAVRCAAWRWLPGMLTQHGRICGAGYLVSDDVDEGGQPYVDCTDTVDDWSGLLPDLADPATLGALQALVRSAWEDPTIGAVQAGDYQTTVAGLVVPTTAHWLVMCAGAVGLDVRSHGSSEAEALVLALESAP